MAFMLNIGKCSLLGNYRENNEDSIEVKQFPDLIVSIVADGMGGQAAGEIASKRAIEIIPRELRKNLAAHLNPDAVKSVLRKSIVQANEEIMAMGALDKDMKNMGTTVVMAVWRKGTEMHVAGVGDSRCYLLRGDQLTQLSRDQTMAQELIDMGVMRPSDTAGTRLEHTLSSSIGGRQTAPAITRFDLTWDTVVLLCSDGLTRHVSDERIAERLRQTRSSREACEALLADALAGGGSDNITIVVRRVVPSH
jgi:PPM family protein phosphatase